MNEILETICDLESERGVLGCCLIDPQKVFEVFDQCGPDALELFTDPKLGAVWIALVDLVSDGVTPDLLQLSIVLKKTDTTPAQGWVVMLSELQDSVPSAENLSFYFESAKEAALKRKAGAYLTATYQKLVEATGPVRRVLEEAEAGLMQLNTEHKKENLTHLPEAFDTTIKQIDEYRRGQPQLHGLSTGYSFLDKKMGGLVPGEMIVIAGRPGGGKTALGLNIAINQVTRAEPTPVLFFSMEMTVRELASRVLFSEAKANMVEFRTGCVLNEDFPKLAAAEEALRNIPVWIDDRAGLTIAQIANKARQVKLMHGIGLIVVDYLQLAHSGSGNKFQSRQEEVSTVSMGLKSLAKSLEVPVIALAQLNRNAAKSKYEAPNLADLRESGQIEQDADFVGLLHEVIPRTEEEEKLSAGDDEYTKHTKLIIAKQRSGPTGEVHFKFKKSYVRFETFNFENKFSSDYKEATKPDFDAAEAFWAEKSDTTKI